MCSKPSDEQLHRAIDDRSGTLEDNQIHKLINDSFKSLGRNKQVNSNDVNHFIHTIDQNGDGKISKVQLFDILKYLINRN